MSNEFRNNAGQVFHFEDRGDHPEATYELRTVMELLATLKRDRGELETRLGALNSHIVRLQEWHDRLRASGCLNCKGYGKIRVWLAQDESRLETCIDCGGSGINQNAAA